LKGFSEALRGELINRPNIHICDIYPTFVDTPAISNAGNYTGRALTAPPPVIDARRVAKAVVRTAERPRATTLVGEGASLIRWGSGWFPNYTSRFMSIFMRSYLEQADRVPTASGNLFGPPSAIQGIDGGLRSPEQRAVAGLIAAGAIGGLAVIGLGAWALHSRFKSTPKRRLRRRSLR
jgi:hypothetical protein